MATIYTFGHSTRELPETLSVLQAHGIRTLVDIRAFPASRRLPQFNRENLERELPAAGIEYRWMPQLGGRRRKCSSSLRTWRCAMTPSATTRTTCSRRNSRALSTMW